MLTTWLDQEMTRFGMSCALSVEVALPYTFILRIIVSPVQALGLTVKEETTEAQVQSSIPYSPLLLDE